MTHKSKKPPTVQIVRSVPLGVESCLAFALGPGLTHAIRSSMGAQLERAWVLRQPVYDKTQFIGVKKQHPLHTDMIQFSEEALVKFAIGSRILRSLERASPQAHSLCCLYYGDHGFRADKSHDDKRDAVLYPTTELCNKLLKTTLHVGDDILGQTFNLIDGMKNGQHGGKEALWEIREEARAKRLWMQAKLVKVCEKMGYTARADADLLIPE